MFYNIQTLCDTVHIFFLHLIKYKGGIGVPVGMAPIFFFFLRTLCHKNFFGNKLFTKFVMYKKKHVVYFKW